MNRMYKHFVYWHDQIQFLIWYSLTNIFADPWLVLSDIRNNKITYFMRPDELHNVRWTPKTAFFFKELE